MGKVLDVRGGAGHGEQSSKVGVGGVGGKTQSSALEMNTGLMPETLKRNRQTSETMNMLNACPVFQYLTNFKLLFEILFGILPSLL